MEFSERLKELRKQAHLTQVELASKLGKRKEKANSRESSKDSTDFECISWLPSWKFRRKKRRVGQHWTAFPYEFKGIEWWREENF